VTTNKAKTEHHGESSPNEAPDYPGEDRRTGSDKPDVHADISFDAKGNPVWEVRVESPRRRSDDDTIDLLKCLDSDLLLEQEEEDELSTTGGYNPYNRD
jgi:hypothetical protein